MISRNLAHYTVIAKIGEGGMGEAYRARDTKLDREVAINYVSRIPIPVIMLNGKYDHFFPVESSQIPMYRLLGTPPEHKKHYLYESGHFVPRQELMREVPGWLEKYLGAGGT